MAKTILISSWTTGALNTIGFNVTRYSAIAGARAPGTTESSYQTPIRTGGTISGMCVNVTTNSLDASTTYRLRINAVNSTPVILVTTTQTGVFQDTSGTATVVSGDLLGVMSVTGGTTGSIGDKLVSFEFDTNQSTTRTLTRLICSSGNATGNTGQTGASVIYYRQLHGVFETTAPASEANIQFKCQYSGTFKNLGCRISANSRATTTVLRFRKNAVNANMSVVIPASPSGTGNFEDLTNTDSVVSGDLVNYAITNGTGTLAITWNAAYCGFETTTNPGTGLTTALQSAPVAFARATTFPLAIAGTFSNSTLQTDVWTQTKLNSSITFKGLAMRATANTIATTTPNSVLSLRKNGVNTGLTCLLGGTATGWVQDLTNTASAVATDLINFSFATGTGASTQTITIAAFSVYTESAGASSGATQSKTITDSLVMTDGILMSRGVIQLRTDTLTLTHTSTNRNRLLNRTRTDSVTLTHTDTTKSIIRNLTRTLSESFVISHLNNTVRNRLRPIADALTIAHTSTQKIEHKIRSFTDALTLTDTRNRVRNKTRSSTDTITITDTRQRIIARLKTITDSLVLVASDPTRIRNRMKAVSDSLVFSSVANRFRLLNQAISEGITLSSTVTRLKNIVRNRTDNISLSDTRVYSRLRLKTISDTLTLASNNLHYKSLLKSISDTLGISKNILRMVQRNRISTDSLTLSSINQKSSSKLRTLTDNINLSSVGEAVKLKLKQFQQTLSLSDVPTKATPYRIKSFGDSLTLSSTTTKLINKMRELSDNIILNAQLHKEKRILRSLLEGLGLFDLSSKTTNRNRVITDTLGFVHGSFDTVRQRLRMVTQGLTLNDMVQTGSAKVKIILDQLNLDSQVSRLQAIVRSLQDNIQLESQTNGLTTRLRTLTDNINFGDISSKIKLRLGLVSHELAFSSSSVRALDRLKTLFHNVTISSHLQGIKSKSREISHTLSFQDIHSNSVLSALIKSFGDSISFGAESVRSRLKKATITDTLNIQSTTTRIREALIRLLPIQVTILNDSIMKRREIGRTVDHSLLFTESIFNTVKAAIKSFHLKISRYRLFRF